MAAPRFAIVGEAWGEQEERALRAFFGPAGQELTRQLLEVGIDRQRCLLTNVIQRRPPNNELRNFCLFKGAAAHTYRRVRPELVARHPEVSWPEDYNWPPLVGPGGFLHPEFLGELGRLAAELRSFQPDLIIALGNTACWGLLRTSGIGKLRGYIYPCTLVPGLRVLPTYHPSSVLRQYSNRHVVLADLAKALRVASPTEAISEALSTNAKRLLWIEPTLGDITDWWAACVEGPAVPLSVDIETFGGTITCIGFGTAESAISIPLWDRFREGGCYWETASDESQALALIAQFLRSPNPKIFQNGMYDVQYIWRCWGIAPRGEIDDTMLIHHALQPEMSKDLNFLGATYSDVPAWKHMRKQSAAAIRKGKRDA